MAQLWSTRCSSTKNELSWGLFYFHQRVPVSVTQFLESIGHKKSDIFKCSKSKMKTPAQYTKSVQTWQLCHGHRFGVFIVNFEHISHNVLLFPLLTLNKQMPAEYPQNTLQLVLMSFYNVVLLNFGCVPNNLKFSLYLILKHNPGKPLTSFWNNFKKPVS